MHNPFGMDEGCTNCPALVPTRHDIVHGFGDVHAEFFFVFEAPSAESDAHGHPLATDGPFSDILTEVGFQIDKTDPDDAPVLNNAFISHLARCYHPERPPRDDEIAACDPFLTAEIRSINPELLVPIGERPLAVLAEEYTTHDVSELAIEAVHGEPIRGRGFELLPMVAPPRLTDERIATFIDAMETTMGRDYRQTKGRRSR